MVILFLLKVWAILKHIFLCAAVFREECVYKFPELLIQFYSAVWVCSLLLYCRLVKSSNQTGAELQKSSSVSFYPLSGTCTSPEPGNSHPARLLLPSATDCQTPEQFYPKYHNSHKQLPFLYTTLLFDVISVWLLLCLLLAFVATHIYCPVRAP